MNRKNCNATLPENQTKCPNCGTENIPETQVQTESEYISAAGAEKAIPKGFSSKKNIIIVIVAAIMLIVGGVTAVAVTTNGFDFTGIRTTLQLADRYFSEQNYEQAIIEFEKVLEIEPMNVDAYLGLAEAYMALGEIDKAIETLEKGIEQTDSDKIRDRLEEIRESLKPATTEPTITEPVATSAAQTETIITTTAAPISIPSTIPEYSVYELTFEGTPKTPDQLADFTLNIHCPDDLSALFNNIGHPEFKELFSNARALKAIISVNGVMYLMDWTEYEKIPKTKIRKSGHEYSITYYETGYGFKSFYSYCLNSFTDDYLNSLFSGRNMNVAIINGGLWLIGVGIGGDPNVIHTEYRVSKQTETEIEIEQVNYRSYNWGEVFDPLKKDQYETRIETVKFSLTSNGWRVSEIYFP